MLLFLPLVTPAYARDLIVENTTSSLLTVNGTSGFIGIGTPNATWMIAHKHQVKL